MIWLYMGLLAAVTLAPLIWSGLHTGRMRGRRDAALALHRAQLSELDRDLADGRILAAEHEAARLEIQRRLLAEAAQAEAATKPSPLFPLFITACLIPSAALLLYVSQGAPDYAARRAAASLAQKAQAQAEAEIGGEEMIARLRQKIATLDPHSESARRGFAMLGNLQAQLGHLTEAEATLRQSLAIGFDPNVGAETAEIISEIQGKVTPEAAGLFKRALAEASPDAPWRKEAEKRLTETGG